MYCKIFKTNLDDVDSVKQKPSTSIKTNCVLQRQSTNTININQQLFDDHALLVALCKKINTKQTSTGSCWRNPLSDFQKLRLSDWLSDWLSDDQWRACTQGLQIDGEVLRH